MIRPDTGQEGRKGRPGQDRTIQIGSEGSSHPKPNLTHHPTLPLQHGSTIQSSTIVLRDCRTKDIYIYVRYYHQKERGTATLPRRKKNKKNKTVQKLYTKFSEFSTLFFPLPSLSLLFEQASRRGCSFFSFFFIFLVISGFCNG